MNTSYNSCGPWRGHSGTVLHTAWPLFFFKHTHNKLTSFCSLIESFPTQLLHRLPVRKNSTLNTFEGILMKIKHPFGRSNSNSQNIARRQSSVSSLWWWHRLSAETNTGQIQNWSSLWRTELFFFQLSFLSSQKPGHFMYITWINNHCTPQKHQWSAAMIKHITVATHLKVRRTEFCSKIPSITKINFRLSCLSSW